MIKKQAVFLVIICIICNVLLFPAYSLETGEKIHIGSELSKTGFFFTVYTVKMMQLAIDMVSDGSSLPSPVKKQAKEKKKTDSNTQSFLLNYSDTRISGNLTDISAHPVFTYDVLPAIGFETGHNQPWMQYLFVILSIIMLIYALPRGAIDGNAVLVKYRKM